MNMEGPQQSNKIEKKRQHITAQDLRNTKDVIELNGIKYMPTLDTLVRNPALSEEIYGDHEEQGVFEDDVIYLPSLNYAGLNGYYLEGRGMLYDLEIAFKLGRLKDVRQLSFARGVTFHDGELEFIEGFHHNRYIHSFDVLAIANLIGNNAELSEEDIKILQVAALSHDYLTPAGGDTTKKVDQTAFDEDAHYGEIFSTKEWETFAKEYGITKEQEEKLRQTVLGEGVLGKLLDLSDKMAYVARDISRYLNHEVRIERDGEGGPGLGKIKSFIRQNSLVCSMWDAVGVDGDKVFINDASRLEDFLRVRALMWKYLYENFEGGLSISILSERIINYLYKKGDLTKEYLLSVGDSQLEEVLSEFLGVQRFPALTTKLPHVSENFSNLNDAFKFAQKFNNEPGKIVVINDFKIASSPSTKKFLVETKDGIMSFDQARPDAAEEINAVMGTPNMVNVYVVSLSDLEIPKSNWAKVKEAFNIERQLSPS